MTTLPQRKSPRLQGYDYSQSGAYFITICTHQRQNLFGEVIDGVMHCSQAGDIAMACWHIIPNHYPAVELDAFVVMPNHIHGILVLDGDGKQFKTVLGRVINGYKGAVTARIREQIDSNLVAWQGRYHDHIIRDERGLNLIRAYVENNPAKWSNDSLFGTEA
jgi:REP element-mobilizing transposase RayT